MLRAVLVEDEPPTRARLRRMLGAHADALAVVGEAGDADEAARLVAEHRPDVLFLDVQLPGADGFALLERLGASGGAVPHVVFVTAYAAYAVQAFEAAVLDFLVKPVEADRLAATVGRLRARLAAASVSGALASGSPVLDSAALARLAEAVRPRAAPPTALPVRTGGGFAFVPLADVTCFEAKDKVVLAHTVDGRAHAIDPSLTALAARLPEAFVQVSRALIVHRLHLKTARREGGTGRYVLTLSTGERFPTGPAYADAVARLLAF